MKKALVNWKTTLAGVLTGAPLIACQLFHVCSVGHVGNLDWLQVLSGVGAIFMGAYAKDNNVTGGEKQNASK
jgi:hypothetical protein